MPTVDDLPELPELVKAVLVVIVRMMLALSVVLQTLLWTFGVCAVVDIFTYWRGY